MMFHTGYLSKGEINTNEFNQNIKIQGMPYGIGGVLRFNFGNHIRFGSEGYTSTLHYENNSSMTLGWGGILIDCQWNINKLTIFAGGTAGGGKVKNIIVDNSIEPNLLVKNAVYQQYTIIISAPFTGIEYSLTDRIRIISKIDYIFNVSEKQKSFASGPRVYAGIVFFHRKK